MSQEALRKLLERAASDEEFAAYLKNEPVKALTHLDISSTEVFTLTCADEDALRRLLGAAEEDVPTVDFSLFAAAAAPVFDKQMATEIENDPDAGKKTCNVTSATVTTCCYP